MLVITHYQRLLNYIVPDKVHVLADGRIQRSGGKELALELEKSGYAELRRPKEAALIAKTRVGGAIMNVAVMKTKAEQALAEAVRPPCRRHCRAGRLREARAPFGHGEVRERWGCRTGASKNGSTPTCAIG